MIILRLFLLLFLCESVLFSQEFLLYDSIGDFENASAFHINPAGYIFVTDIEKNEITKLDTLGNEILTIGGFGWTGESFDEPVDIYASILDVYVTDKNNHRIQIFDKDLNYLSSFSTQNSENSDFVFAYPVSCATSNQGDLFILDSDNSRVLKYDLSGNFLIEIGGIDAGNFTLDNPSKLAISPDSKIYIADDNSFLVFDLYGTGLLKYNSDFEEANINITFNYLTTNDKKRIRILDLKNPQEIYAEFYSDDLPADEIIIEAALFKGKLYILTETKIYIYKVVQ